ncbi:MAG: class I SAM-dependent methyltransferase [Candidatus Neomarinimicrobiota bacterium]
MLSFLTEELEAYCRRQTTPDDPIYQELEAYTRANTEMPQMLAGYQVGALLQLLVRSLGARRVVEVGTFTGYTSLKLAEALPPDGKVHTCEINASYVDIVREFASRVAWGDRIIVHHGPARDTLAGLKPPFDLAFIDADKENYRRYYLACKSLLRPGGVIVLDNALWSGRVLDPPDAASRAIHLTNAFVTGDAEVTNVLLPIRDGLMLAQKLVPADT